MLKNILSLLLSKFYSKQESEAVGHQALPASSYTTLFTNKTTTSWGTVASGVAANDGYLKLQSNGSGSTTAALMVMTPRLTSVIQYPFETAGISAWVPIAKGETWKVQGSDSTSINLYLYKTIGEGYKALKNALLQGGGLCLSRLYSSLRRNSWLARRRVFRTGRIPASQIVLPFSFHLQKTILFIHPQATDGCRCTLGTRGLLTLQLILTQRIIAQSCLAFCLLRPVGTATFIEYVKALMSRSQFQILYRKDGLCFFRLINSAVGGASC